MADTRKIVSELERKVLWLSSWMIHNANHLRPNEDGVKVGGHQASSASLATIMTALYFDVLRPQDRVAVKPHASPVFHAIQYLLGNQTQAKLERFRAFGGAQAYPSRTKDSDDVDFSTGSVGLGVAMTAFASLVRDYIGAKGWGKRTTGGRMVALVGDAELDEGNIYEALLEGCKHEFTNVWWIIDYNRQSLDGVSREGLGERYTDIFRSFGWDIVILKYGRLLEEAFNEPGGRRLREWIDECPNARYSSLTFQGGAAWRVRLEADFAGDNEVLSLIGARDDGALGKLMTNLAGHDLDTLRETFNAVSHDRPICFIAYTIKGFGLPLAGHKDNHAGLLNTAQMEALREQSGVRPGHEWEQFEGLSVDEKSLKAFLKSVAFNAKGARRHTPEPVDVPPSFDVTIARRMSTQDGFGKIMAEIGRLNSAFAQRVVTASPDVSVSTNLGGWINRKGLFARAAIPDVFHEDKVVSAQKWAMSPNGQHIELGIAENNLFILLAALGLSHSVFDERLLPVGTLYDPFINRGLDALNYACYQDARFMLAATPAGITLSPEGGAHQSIGTPLIGMSQDGLAYFEPAFVDELEAIMAWGFRYMQRDSETDADDGGWLRDEKGGSVYLRLSTRPLEQPVRELGAEARCDIVRGAYWMRPPGPACEVVIVYTGSVAEQAIEAAGLVGEDRKGVALLSVTSADRLNAEWNAAERARQRGDASAQSHVERLFSQVPRDAGVVTVLDGHPATLSWLGAVYGHRVKPLGVEHFGQSGNIRDLHRHHGIDANAIAHSANAVSPGKPVRYLAALA